MTDLAGARALVTGAASGIGLGIARALLDRGAAVAVVDIDAEAVEAAVDQLGERGTVFRLPDRCFRTRRVRGAARGRRAATRAC
ncbi:SDR family NAD(P)-dependent oxidoreductase [Streptomyces malaysiensis]|nr:SDR family NAD(P)-dependent oxidoreductase [Streptomyces malaysiensis]